MERDTPQKGNPHRLTVNQHIFPEASIRRFSQPDGLVDVLLRRIPKRIRKSPSDRMFCAYRAWDQRAERGYMREIEDEFQLIADRIINGSAIVSEGDHRAITRFLVLWRLRAKVSSSPLEDVELDGITGEQITQDQQEMLERQHVIFCGPNNTVPGRMIAGGRIQLEIDATVKTLKAVKWGIGRTVEGEIAVPDTFDGGMIVPVSPSIVLLATMSDCQLSREAVTSINKLGMQQVSRFLFARDLDQCPGIKTAQPAID